MTEDKIRQLAIESIFNYEQIKWEVEQLNNCCAVTYNESGERQVVQRFNESQIEGILKDAIAWASTQNISLGAACSYLVIFGG